MISLALVALVSASSDDVLVKLEARQIALYEQAAKAVVYISTGEAFGSGFFFGAPGLVLTNRHVVGKAKKVDVVLQDGRRVVGTVRELASGNIDLALVDVPVRDVEPLRASSLDRLRVGAFVAAVGHGRGGVWSFNTGMVSNIYDAQVFQTQIPLNPGNSGGPVIDSDGRVLGVVTAGITDANNLNFALRVDLGYRTLAGLADHCDCLVITAPNAVPVFVDGENVGQGPRVTLALAPGRHEVFAVVGGKMHKKFVSYPSERRLTLP